MKKFLIIIPVLLGILFFAFWPKKEEPKIEKQEIKATPQIDAETYRAMQVNELGEIPIMMYHGIQNKKNDETNYTGGNIDRDGYQRTSEAFRQDLAFYYEKGYRMIRLMDYIEGKIDVPLGKSPIVLTFDDGLENNIKVTGIKEDGSIEIDPNSAVGILEEFKKTYPDFQVTATFFINSGLFSQPEYNEKILKWLVDHGYDIGNHSSNHPDFTKISEVKTVEEIGSMYRKLDTLIPNRYVPIVALPFGSPYDQSHKNFNFILHGTHEDFTYETKATLRVGWESNDSPFHKDFNPLFLKRIRAYDNDGKEFDIAMNFKFLDSTRYISDGDPNLVVFPESRKDQLKNPDISIYTY